MAHTLRTHQNEINALASAIAQGTSKVRNILADVTPGGGKSALPIILGSHLLGQASALPIDKICWIVPRDSLRRQAEEGFMDRRWRTILGHNLSLRAAENGRDMSRGLNGYVTTYQAIAADPAAHLAEFRKHKYLVVLDEAHHCPASEEGGQGSGWTTSIEPLLKLAKARLFLSGTLKRADKKPLLGLPYKNRSIDHGADGWAVITYDRKTALAERAVLPTTFAVVDGTAEWIGLDGQHQSINSLKSAGDKTKEALFTALRTEYAEDLLSAAFRDCREHRARRRQELDLGPRDIAPGLGKLLVVAPDQACARAYDRFLRRHMGNTDAAAKQVRIAISDNDDANEAIQEFRRTNGRGPSILVTVGMAYEGLDVPEISHIACLTHIRSYAWLEQMLARATRVDPHGGPYEHQRAMVYHPDDEYFALFKEDIERSQKPFEERSKTAAQRDPMDSDEREPVAAIQPLGSAATTVRAEDRDPETLAAPYATAVDDVIQTPSQREAQVRKGVNALIQRQVRDDHTRGLSKELQYHAYNSIFQSIFKKNRKSMTLIELEEALRWLQTNNLRDHLSLIETNHRFHYAVRQKKNILESNGRELGAKG